MTLIITTTPGLHFAVIVTGNAGSFWVPDLSLIDAQTMRQMFLAKGIAPHTVQIVVCTRSLRRSGVDAIVDLESTDLPTPMPVAKALTWEPGRDEVPSCRAPEADPTSAAPSEAASIGLFQPRETLSRAQVWWSQLSALAARWMAWLLGDRDTDER